MGINSGKKGGADAVMFVLSIGYMTTRPGISKLFSQAKVDDVDKVCVFAGAHDEIGGFDVAVDEVAGVDVLDA